MRVRPLGRHVRVHGLARLVSGSGAIDKGKVKRLSSSIYIDDRAIEFPSNHVARITSDEDVLLGGKERAGLEDLADTVPGQRTVPDGVFIGISLTRPAGLIFRLGIIIPNQRLSVPCALIDAPIQPVRE